MIEKDKLNKRIKILNIVSKIIDALIVVLICIMSFFVVIGLGKGKKWFIAGIVIGMSFFITLISKFVIAYLYKKFNKKLNNLIKETGEIYDQNKIIKEKDYDFKLLYSDINLDSKLNKKMKFYLTFAGFLLILQGILHLLVSFLPVFRYQNLNGNIYNYSLFYALSDFNIIFKNIFIDIMEKRSVLSSGFVANLAIELFFSLCLTIFIFATFLGIRVLFINKKKNMNKITMLLYSNSKNSLTIISNILSIALIVLNLISMYYFLIISLTPVFDKTHNFTFNWAIEFLFVLYLIQIFLLSYNIVVSNNLIKEFYNNYENNITER